MSALASGHWAVGCRFHPNLSADSSPAGTVSMSQYPDMQKLLAAADCLITDYSSCMFDMALAGKSCFLFAPDLQEYREKERGLYFDIESLPFPLALDMPQLVALTANFDKAAYSAAVTQFMTKIKNYEDGSASERVGEYITERSGI